MITRTDKTSHRFSDRKSQTDARTLAAVVALHFALFVLFPRFDGEGQPRQSFGEFVAVDLDRAEPRPVPSATQASDPIVRELSGGSASTRDRSDLRPVPAAAPRDTSLQPTPRVRVLPENYVSAASVDTEVRGIADLGSGANVNAVTGGGNGTGTGSGGAGNGTGGASGDGAGNSEWRAVREILSARRFLTRYYPNEAKLADIDRGIVVLECRALRRARVRDCILLDEAPKGYGFGEAALRAESAMRWQLIDAEGREVVGERFRFRAWFALD